MPQAAHDGGLNARAEHLAPQAEIGDAPEREINRFAPLQHVIGQRAHAFGVERFRDSAPASPQWLHAAGLSEARGTELRSGVAKPRLSRRMRTGSGRMPRHLQ